MIDEKKISDALKVEDNAFIELVKILQHPRTNLHRIVNYIISFIIIVGGSVSGYAIYQQNQITKQTNSQMELLNKFYIIQNQTSTLLTIIDKNLKDSDSAAPGSAPMEEKVAVCKILMDMGTLRQIPISLLAAIAHVESRWNTHAVSGKECVGLLQITPLYARPYLRENRIDYKKDIYFDPVTNSIVGISMLVDYQNEVLEKGLTTPGNYVFALHHYFWGPAKRDNKFDMNYSLKIIEAMKEFQKQGLT